MKHLHVIGARQHNLKNVSCEIPRNQLVVFCGPSGSGKSSLAFDTIYAEANRLFLDALPSAARRGIDHLPRPDVDEVSGLSPAIALRQTAPIRHTRSTVGTLTELSDYLRVLFARAATAHCPVGGEVLKALTAQQIVDHIAELPEGAKVTLLAPVLRHGSSEMLSNTLKRLRGSGYARVRHNGDTVLLDELNPPFRPLDHELDLVVDRWVLREGLRPRIADSVELALREGAGTVIVDVMDGSQPQALSETLTCATHHQLLPSPEPALFSFNSRTGACPTCAGLGIERQPDADRLVPNPNLTLRQGALAPFGRPGSLAFASFLDELVSAIGVDPDTPWGQLSAPIREQILLGSTAVSPVPTAQNKRRRATKPGYRGIANLLEQLIESDDREPPLDGSPSVSEVASFFRAVPCTVCKTTRLGPAANHFRFLDCTFSELCALPIATLQACFSASRLASMLTAPQAQLLQPLTRAVFSRTQLLLDLGLGYLTLSTPSLQLSSGETRRVRLATQLGAPLAGVLYVLDEPSAGLHPADLTSVQHALKTLVALGNSVLVVEHERSLIEAADWVVDMGPGAGTRGGEIVAQGSVAALSGQPSSVTAPYLDGRQRIMRTDNAAGPAEGWLQVRGARAGNLQSIDVRFPKRRITAVTGVSGAGKSSLLIETLLPALRAALRGAPPPVEVCTALDGADDVTRVVALDQTPLGRGPRSNPATYTGIMTLLRELFAALPESRARGFRAARFSFNLKGGRCETCKGEGVQRVELQLLADVTIPCPDCSGARFNRETLHPTYKGLNIAQVLALRVDEATRLFVHVPRVMTKLVELQRVGLGYLQLGQPAPTLSGGEAQRVRLASELSRAGEGHTLYLLDEPTAGLHFQDVQVVCDALFALRNEGHTLILVEHNMDVVQLADWVVDLGPEAGQAGGTVVFTGQTALLAEAETLTATHFRTAQRRQLSS